MKQRLYKSGTTWCVWRWTVTDSEYITRLHLLKTPWFSVCLHWINKPDPEPYLHDHPVSFLSIVLRGGYVERRAYVKNTAMDLNLDKYSIRHEVNHLNYVQASYYDVHRIVEVRPKTLTLVFMGPKRREWGFHTPKGWIFWKDYYTEQRKAKS